jgi:mannitol 2-dehydrogenase
VLGSLPAGVAVPRYGDGDLRVGIVHFGVGNFHRAHEAMYLDRLMNAGLARDWAICGVGLLERDARMRDALVDQDGLYTLTLRHPDGVDETSVIGSIARFLHAPEEPDAVLEQLVSPDVRIVTLTITEGGYVADPINGRIPGDDPLVAAEVATGLAAPRTAFGWIVAALRGRRARGTAPFTVLSCDNIPGNGRVCRGSVVGVARLVDAGLAEWIDAEVAFPSSMVDRITPVTTPADLDRVRETLGVEDAWPVTCEPFAQWVVEDHFPAGRPPLEQVGVTLTDDVEPYEAIKLRLLNGAHQAMAYLGQLAGFTYVDEACADAGFAAFLRAYIETEGVPTLNVPDGVDLPGYVDQLFERFGNPQVRDPLARLAVDTSNRIPKFVLPVVADRLAAGHPCPAGAAVLAAWRAGCRLAAQGRFTLDDEAATPLVAAAGGEPRDFLTRVPTLAPLATDAGFVAAFERAAGLLERGDVRAVIDGTGPDGRDG